MKKLFALLLAIVLMLGVCAAATAETVRDAIAETVTAETAATAETEIPSAVTVRAREATAPLDRNPDRPELLEKNRKEALTNVIA